MYAALFILLLLALIGIIFGHFRRKKIICKIECMDKSDKCSLVEELAKPFGYDYHCCCGYFSSTLDAWQKAAGYTWLYDYMAPRFQMVFDALPVYFDYHGKTWLIEFWKGQYGITTGGEVGVYYLPKKAQGEDLLLPHLVYHCVEDEDTLRIKTILRKKGKQLYFRRGYHWWLTGFVLGEFSKPRELEMDIEITMKDSQMRDAFLKGLYEAGYQRNELNVLGTTVWIHFTRPHTKQPLTRNRLFVAVKQWENKRNCRLYRKATKDYVNTYDKILAIKERVPLLYGKLERLGKSRFGTGEE